jgi:ATP-dependent DNA ligase
MKGKRFGPVWLMQPVPYFGEPLEGEWIWEPKIDGWRLQIIKYEDERIEAWGRRLERNPNWTQKLYDILLLIKEKLPACTILDCELTTEGGRRFIPSLFAKRKRAFPIVYIFDAIFFEGEFVGSLPLMQRQRMIESVKLCPPFVKVVHNPLKDMREALLHSLNERHEGIVMKRVDSPYIICDEGPVATESWRKLKG